MLFSSQRVLQYIQLHASRLVQVGWLLFASFSLSLGAAGVSSYREALIVSCSGSNCQPAQFTPTEWELVLQNFYSSPAERADFDTGMAILISLLLAGSAVLFIWRRPDDPSLVLGGFVFVALAAEPFVDALYRTVPRWLWAIRFLQMVHLAGLAPFLSLLPDARLRPRRLYLPVLACALLGILIPLFGPSQFGLRVSYSVLLGCIVGVSIFKKIKDPADAGQRDQLVWLVVCMMLWGVAQLVSPVHVLLPMDGIVTGVPFGESGILDIFSYSFLGVTFLWTGAMVCLLIGLMPSELFQLEIILNRTMLYAILTLFVVGIYVLVVGYLSLVFQSSGNLIFSLIATGLAAVLFQPMRSWAQRFVNQMLYGDRDKPYAVLDQLGRQLENAMAPQDILEMVVIKVRSVLKLPYVAVVLGVDAPQDYSFVAEEGESKGKPLILPLVVQGQQIGQFILSPRSEGEPFSATDRRLLGDLAGQVGIAAHTAILMIELQHAREKLVHTREEERLRLRRDLHDSLGTTLAALNLQAGNIRKLIPKEPNAADAAVLELRAQIREMISEIRSLINDLRPKTLDEFGLIGAIQLLAAEITSRNGVLVSVEGPDILPVLPPAVEVAAFRIVQESLTNVIKHANARTCCIRIGIEKNLEIVILDDGIGLPDEVSQGIGLRTIRERVVELGGSLSTKGLMGNGTQVFVQLPIRWEEA
jgi:signal transduction histidine kinase